MRVGDIKWAISHWGKIHKIQITGEDVRDGTFFGQAVDKNHSWVNLTESSVYNSKFAALIYQKLGM